MVSCRAIKVVQILVGKMRLAAVSSEQIFSTLRSNRETLSSKKKFFLTSKLMRRPLGPNQAAF